ISRTWTGSFACPRINTPVVRILIFVAVFVHVGNHKITAFRNRNHRNGYRFSPYSGLAAQSVKRLHSCTLMKDSQAVFPRWDILDLERSIPLRSIEVWSRQHVDDGAHRCMNVTKDPHDSCLGEIYTPRLARRIEPYIERLAVVVRKGVMKDRIEVRKVHGRA